MKKEYVSNSMEQTKKIAAEFADSISAGDIVLLNGDLGAGKTVFVKGVAEKMSNGSVVANSPTFLILNIYDTTPKIYHFDLYRIKDVSELDAIGAEEYFYGDGICFVEWSERALNYFPKKSIKVDIIKNGDDKRIIRIER